MPNEKSSYYDTITIATEIDYQKIDAWQFCLKTHKEKLRKEVLCGIQDSNEIFNPIINITEHTISGIPEVKIGTIDMTTQEYIISKFNLNCDQKRAFLIITDHLENKSFMKKSKNLL